MLMQKGFGIGTCGIPVSFQNKQVELLIYTWTNPMDPQVNIQEEGKIKIERKSLDGFANCGRNPCLSCNAN
jgi:hypothetical protein